MSRMGQYVFDRQEEEDQRNARECYLLKGKKVTEQAQQTAAEKAVAYKLEYPKGIFFVKAAHYRRNEGDDTLYLRLENSSHQVIWFEPDYSVENNCMRTIQDLAFATELEKEFTAELKRRVDDIVSCNPQAAEMVQAIASALNGAVK